MARDQCRDFYYSNKGRSGVVRSNIPEKRKCPSSPTYGSDSVESWAVSEIEQETFAFLWTLENFSGFSRADVVLSPIFRGGPSNHSWQLQMHPKNKIKGLEYVSIGLNLTAFGDGNASKNRKVMVRFQISILDADGGPGVQEGSATMDVCEFNKESKWNYDDFILSTDLISPSRRLVNDDSLKIHCRIWIEGGQKNKVCNGGAVKSLPEEEKVKRRKERLANDVAKLFKDTVLADIAVTTNHSTFMAHKAVLAARSSVFAAMFTTGMVETKMNTVEISDFEDDIVKAMLEYLYTGETEMLGERAPDLLQVAEKYDLPGLKEDCEYVIADYLNVENAAQVLAMAHTYNANLLKPRVINFINCNKEDVRKTKSFEQVTKANPNVLLDLYLSQ